MSTIQIKCVDQTLTLTNTPIIASGGTSEDYVQFDFCPLWNGYIKTAVFWRTPTEARTAVLDSNGKALIPHEILTTEGIIYIGAFGTNGKTRRTSEVVRYKVVQGAVSEDTEVPDPSADVWTQILALCADILDRVDNAQAGLDSAAATLAAATEALNNAENKLAGSNITTEQYTNGSVTRAKLAKDALYSPLVQKTGSYTLTTDDIGKTIISDSSSVSDVRVITLDATNNESIPIGTEIAIMAGNTGTTKLTVGPGVGVRGNKDGDVLSSDGITVTIPRYCMIALKKFYAKHWLITGVFEVGT